MATVQDRTGRTLGQPIPARAAQIPERLPPR